MHHASVIFLLRFENGRWEVCLSRKKRKVGVGLLNGAVGIQESGESMRECAMRELFEESGVTADESDMELCAIIRARRRDQSWELYIYVARAWNEEPQESAEHGPPTWHSVENMPFDEMLPDNSYWLKDVLGGKKLEADFLFSRDGQVDGIWYWPPTFLTRLA